jgi:exosortase A-associated hydrolase 1
VNTGAVPHEQALVFDSAGAALVGILHHPAAAAPAPAQATGVVVIVGGPQYRVGSHRQFVHLARALAAAGHAVLRFDVQGMGDSTGDLHTFEQITPEIGAAIDALQLHAPQVRRVVLWGLCDAASAALLYLHDRPDARVCGLCLLNPWVRSPTSLARTQVKHYYLQRLAQREFWAKLLQGGVGLHALRGLLGNVRAASAAGTSLAATSFQQRMAAAWNNFDGDILLVLSGRDYTAKEFAEYASAHAPWPRLLAQARVTQHPIPDADHTFSSAVHRSAAAQATSHWLACLSRAPTPR